MSWYSLTLFPSIAFGLVGLVAVLRAKREDIPQIVCALMRVREHDRPSPHGSDGKADQVRASPGEPDAALSPDAGAAGVLGRQALARRR
jgi:hypothetical protein